jgi:hypothetical protein
MFCSYEWSRSGELKPVDGFLFGMGQSSRNLAPHGAPASSATVLQMSDAVARRLAVVRFVFWSCKQWLTFLYAVVRRYSGDLTLNLFLFL